MESITPRPVVHLELHTDAPDAAWSFYAQLCGWTAVRVETAAGSYLALTMGRRVGGGIVEGPIERPLWLPYVEVADAEEVTERARRLGARVVVGLREGPEGWRSVVSTPAAGEVALWQPKA
jgi:predicted enzyme related to lactoylglutathione lyase